MDNLIKGTEKRNEIDFDDGILLPHNQKIFQMIFSGLNKNNKVLIEQGTGTGKSYLAIKLIKDIAKDKKVLFVSPSNPIKDSFAKIYQKNLGKNYCYFSTALYQGLKSKVDKKYDLIIFDEAHRMGAKIWGDSCQKLIDNNPDARILGLSATLDRSDNVDVSGFFDSNIVSRYSVYDAMKDGVLPCPNYTLSKISFNDEIQNFEDNIKKLRLKQLETNAKNEKDRIEKLIKKIKTAQKQMSEREEVFGALKRKITGKLTSGKFIVFCPSNTKDEEDKTTINYMKQVQKQLNDDLKKIPGVKKIKNFSVFCKRPAKDNLHTISAFANDNSKSIKLLFSINMLNEGLHVDDVDGVIMFRSTNSKIVYLQQLGRALYVGKFKKPLILDFVGNLKYADVKEMQQTIKKVNGVGRNNKNTNKMDLDEFTLDIQDLELMEIYDNLKTFVNDTLYSFNFDEFNEHLLTYKKEYGDLRVPEKYISEDGYKLGQTVCFVRQIKKGTNKSGKPLSDEQYGILEEEGFIWDAQSFDFDKFNEHLLAYKKEYGDLRVPSDYISEDGYKLGQSVVMIRSGKKGKHSTELSKEQYDILGDEGFIWDALSFNFDEFNEHLLAYKKEYGDLRVPKKYVSEDGYKLGAIVSGVRRCKKCGKHGAKLSKEQYDILGDEGFIWDALSFDFDEFNEHLLTYKNVFGDLMVPRTYISEDGYKLGEKVHSVREGKKGKSGPTLTKEQYDILGEEEGFIWDASQRKNKVLNDQSADGDT